MTVQHRGSVDLTTPRTRALPGELSITPEPWTVDALCAQTDPEEFFPDKGGATRQAKAVCASCTVRAECLTYALDHDERFGIWGGLSERERRQLQRMSEAGTS